MTRTAAVVPIPEKSNCRTQGTQSIGQVQQLGGGCNMLYVCRMHNLFACRRPRTKNVATTAAQHRGQICVSTFLQRSKEVRSNTVGWSPCTLSPDSTTAAVALELQVRMLPLTRSGTITRYFCVAAAAQQPLSCRSLWRRPLRCRMS